MKKILFILGTRPEAIKLAPIIYEMRRSTILTPVVCNTEQQKELSTQTLSYFGLTADYTLNVMMPNQDLSCLNAKLLSAINEILSKDHFDATVVQGDTMSVFAGACASFFNHVPVCHVEAGLRSFNLTEPFPEEALRQMVSRITNFHFAPTERSKNFLLSEDIPENQIFVTGNTVVDALNLISDATYTQARKTCISYGILLEKHPVLITVHRRENHGVRLMSIIAAIKTLAERFPLKQFIIPVHPNPNVKTKIFTTLSNLKNIILTPPLDYPELLELQRFSHLILTDSGGIQEEAPTFGVPLLVMRHKTERMEGVDAGFARMVGTNENDIVQTASLILTAGYQETRLPANKNPYGDGNAASRIVKIIEECLS